MSTEKSILKHEMLVTNKALEFAIEFMFQDHNSLDEELEDINKVGEKISELKSLYDEYLNSKSKA